jgi:hypothetical protein
VEIGWCLREEKTLLKKIWGCNWYIFFLKDHTVVWLQWSKNTFVLGEGTRGKGIDVCARTNRQCNVVSWFWAGKMFMWQQIKFKALGQYGHAVLAVLYLNSPATSPGSLPLYIPFPRVFNVLIHIFCIGLVLLVMMWLMKRLVHEQRWFCLAGTWHQVVNKNNYEHHKKCWSNTLTGDFFSFLSLTFPFLMSGEKDICRWNNGDGWYMPHLHQSMFKRLRGMGGMGEGMFDYCVRMFMTGTIAGYVELSLDLNLLLKLCFVLIPSSTLVFPWIMNAWLNFISTDLSRGTTILTPPKNRWGVVNLPFPFFFPLKIVSAFQMRSEIYGKLITVLDEAVHAQLGVNCDECIARTVLAHRMVG